MALAHHRSHGRPARSDRALSARRRCEEGLIGFRARFHAGRVVCTYATGARMWNFADYRNAYRTVKLERSDSGILQVTLHTNDGPCGWDARAGSNTSHVELFEASSEIARDPE